MEEIDDEIEELYHEAKQAVVDSAEAENRPAFTLNGQVREAQRLLLATTDGVTKILLDAGLDTRGSADEQRARMKANLDVCLARQVPPQLGASQPNEVSAPLSTDSAASLELACPPSPPESDLLDSSPLLSGNASCSVPRSDMAERRATPESQQPPPPASHLNPFGQPAQPLPLGPASIAHPVLPKEVPVVLPAAPPLAVVPCAAAPPGGSQSLDRLTSDAAELVLSAVSMEEWQTVWCVLDEHPSTVDFRWDQREALVHFAARQGSWSVMQRLLSYKADVDLMSSEGETALHIAQMHGHTDLISRLTEWTAAATAAATAADAPPAQSQSHPCARAQRTPSEELVERFGIDRTQAHEMLYGPAAAPTSSDDEQVCAYVLVVGRPVWYLSGNGGGSEARRDVSRDAAACKEAACGGFRGIASERRRAW
jgi:hypothetical protein